MGKFQDGHPGGPGRPFGSRNCKPVTDFMRTDAPQRVAALIDKEIDEGERWGVTMYLRALPKMRGRPVHFDLAKIKAAADVVEAYAMLLDAVSQGEITPEEADCLSRTLERTLQGIETAILERGLKEVERKLAENEQRQQRLKDATQPAGSSLQARMERVKTKAGTGLSDEDAIVQGVTRFADQAKADEREALLEIVDEAMERQAGGDQPAALPATVDERTSESGGEPSSGADATAEPAPPEPSKRSVPPIDPANPKGLPPYLQWQLVINKPPNGPRPRRDPEDLSDD